MGNREARRLSTGRSWTSIRSGPGQSLCSSPGPRCSWGVRGRAPATRRELRRWVDRSLQAVPGGAGGENRAPARARIYGWTSSQTGHNVLAIRAAIDDDGRTSSLQKPQKVDDEPFDLFWRR